MVNRPDLFTEQRDDLRLKAAPLAARMRPASLDEVVGQPGLLAPGAAFRSLVESGRPMSMILWGPPGSGKTTLARLVASSSSARFAQLSASSAGVKDVREVLAEAQRRIDEDRGRTILFLDEIHRFNKSQQDALLPGVEDGVVVLVGATTENPFFEVNSPLISRATVFRTESLDPADVMTLVQRAHTDPVRGLGGEPELDQDAAEALAERVGGDARLALNALEAAAAIASGRGVGAVDLAVIEEALQRRVIRYDKAGDRHYDVISAFIKSMRGSDPDAAVYWLHVMLEAGEDPEFIARRIVVFASEDVGLADPAALTTAIAAFEALQFVGLPEAAFHLTHAALAMATAPKSASVKTSMGAAAGVVRENPANHVPAHLRSASTAGERAMGHGVGYIYPHDDPRGVVPQHYLPEGIEDLVLFRPGTHGAEAEIAQRQRKIDRILGKNGRFSTESDRDGVEGDAG